METAISPMYSSALQNIGTLLKANIPYIWVNTFEERRFIKTLHAEITEKQGKELWTWSCHQGLLKYDPEDKILKASGDMEKTPNPIIALGKIADYNKPKDCKGTVYVMKDFHTALQQTVPRQMRDLYHLLVQSRKTIIITSPGLTHGAAGRSAGMEPTLEKQISVVPYDLPTRSAIEDYLKLSIAHIKAKHKNKKVKTKLDYTKEDIEKFASALCGLTELEITNAVATSICHMQRIDEKKLLQEKKQIVARSAILEYIDSTPKIEDVGGLDSAKQYFDTYSTQFSKEAREFGVKPLRGVLLTGVPGCVHSNTVVRYNRGKRVDYREITVEDLHDRFNQCENRYQWNPEIPTYLHSFDGEGRLVKNRVLGVIDSGIKNLVELNVTFPPAGHTVLWLTPDHPVCTSTGGYIAAGDLVPGATVLLRGTMKPETHGGKQIKLRPKRRTVETLKYHSYASQHEVNGIVYQRSNYARLVIEAHMNAITTEELIDILKTNRTKATTLKYLPSHYDVHHIDENPQNDEISNLMVMEHSAHAKLHSKVENFGVNYLQEGTVESVSEWGSGRTFDIQMEYPHNNFVANDIVVHNTGKSLLAKAIAALWSLPLLRLDVGKVMTGLVGGSEEKMRQVISQVEAIAPCILWIDEIEKSLSGSKSSNFSDGGTLARVFGTLLTAMEEGLEGVVTIATANDIAALPPELIRRFNEVMFVDLPVPEEREEIFGIHLRKCGRDIKKLNLDMDELVAKTHLYTGSEIEKSVHEAIARAFRKHKGKQDLGQAELVGAVEDTKCIAKVMADKIGAIREWARDKARYASSLAEAAASPGNQKVTTSSGKELDLKSELDDLDEVVPTGKEQKAKDHAAAGGDFAQFDAVMDDD